MRANLLLLAGALLVSLILVELGLRLYGIEGTGPRAATRLTTYEFDDELGWRPKAHHRAYRSSDFYAHFTHFDAARLAVAESDLDRVVDERAASLALIGDSFVEGYYVPYEQSFAQRLGAAVPDLQMLNLGVSGYSPEQYLLRARRLLPDLNVAHIVVAFFAANDVPNVDEAIYQGYAKPVLSADLSHAANAPLTRLDRPERDDGLLRRIVRRLAIYSVLRPLYKRLTGPTETGTLDPAALRLDPARLDRAVGMLAALGEVALAASLDAVYIPMYQELRDPEILARNTALFRESCARRDLTCHVPAFGELSPEAQRSLYIAPESWEGHFTAAGSARFADLLVEIVKARRSPPDA